MEKNIAEKIFFSIDRFEENLAICENIKTHKMKKIKKNLLPKNCKEGSLIKFENNEYTLDEIQTKKAKQEIKKLVDGLFKRKN